MVIPMVAPSPSTASDGNFSSFCRETGAPCRSEITTPLVQSVITGTSATAASGTLQGDGLLTSGEREPALLGGGVGEVGSGDRGNQYTIMPRTSASTVARP